MLRPFSYSTRTDKMGLSVMDAIPIRIESGKHITHATANRLRVYLGGLKILRRDLHSHASAEQFNVDEE